MAVDTNLASLFEKLKLEDPYVQPTQWESIPSESGFSSSLDTNRFSHVQYSTSAVSVRTLFSFRFFVSDDFAILEM
ncbi:hypothetical protein KY285_008586 [Solanum tuberosum]|nr:hypothetical protein KY285_008586 [Solanum tuberosum]